MAAAADGNSGGGGQSRPGHKGNESDLYKGSAEFLMNLCLLCTRKVSPYFHNFSFEEKHFFLSRCHFPRGSVCVGGRRDNHSGCEVTKIYKNILFPIYSGSL